MFLGGALFDIMVKVTHKIYQKYLVVSSKGKPLLYIQIKKALYVLLRILLLFYRILLKEPEAYVFHINLYDPCVANNMINDKKMTSVWHVKNLKVSHVDSL